MEKQNSTLVQWWWYPVLFFAWLQRSWPQIMLHPMFHSPQHSTKHFAFSFSLYFFSHLADTVRLMRTSCSRSWNVTSSGEGKQLWLVGMGQLLLLGNSFGHGCVHRGASWSAVQKSQIETVWSMIPFPSLGQTRMFPVLKINCFQAFKFYLLTLQVYTNYTCQITLIMSGQKATCLEPAAVWGFCLLTIEDVWVTRTLM